MDVHQGERVGGYVIFLDHEGLRHAVRPGAVVAASDADPCQDSTVVQLPGGRFLMVQAPLERILEWLDSRPGR